MEYSNIKFQKVRIVDCLLSKILSGTPSSYMKPNSLGSQHKRPIVASAILRPPFPTIGLLSKFWITGA